MTAGLIWTDGLTNFNIPGCGVVNGGPWSWTATWQDNSQPILRSATVVGSESVESVAATGNFYTVTPMK